MQCLSKYQAWSSRSAEPPGEARPEGCDLPKDQRRFQAFASASEVYQTIRDAILARQPLSGFQLGRWTIIYPHALGTVGKEPYVLCFGQLDETDFASSPWRTRPQWYWLPIAHLSHLTVEVGPWRSAPAYTQPRLTGFQLDVVVPEIESPPACSRSGPGSIPG